MGQRLFIPGSNTKGYSTPTPVGMVQISTADASGRIVHIVQAYNTLITIADTYRTSVDKLLAYNGLQLDWPLRIGQKLVIYPGNFTPSPTPRPLTPIEKLTPESDGKYYHTVSSGETLSWISSYYGVSLSELMAWNGLDASSVIRPGEKLLLQVTPPATETPAPLPVTDTPLPSPVPSTPTPTQRTETQTPTATSFTTPPAGGSLLGGGTTTGIIILVVVLTAGGWLLARFLMRRMQSG